jgi:hypothetical protein
MIYRIKRNTVQVIHVLLCQYLPFAIPTISAYKKNENKNGYFGYLFCGLKMSVER